MGLSTGEIIGLVLGVIVLILFLYILYPIILEYFNYSGSTNPVFGVQKATRPQLTPEERKKELQARKDLIEAANALGQGSNTKNSGKKKRWRFFGRSPEKKAVNAEKKYIGVLRKEGHMTLGDAQRKARMIRFASTPSNDPKRVSEILDKY